MSSKIIVSNNRVRTLLELSAMALTPKQQAWWMEHQNDIPTEDILLVHTPLSFVPNPVLSSRCPLHLGVCDICSVFKETPQTLVHPTYVKHRFAKSALYPNCLTKTAGGTTQSNRFGDQYNFCFMLCDRHRDAPMIVRMKCKTPFDRAPDTVVIETMVDDHPHSFYICLQKEKHDFTCTIWEKTEQPHRRTRDASQCHHTYFPRRFDHGDNRFNLTGLLYALRGGYGEYAPLPF